MNVSTPEISATFQTKSFAVAMARKLFNDAAPSVPAVPLIDVDMPSLNGRQTVQRLHAAREPAALRFVASNALTDELRALAHEKPDSTTSFRRDSGLDAECSGSTEATDEGIDRYVPLRPVPYGNRSDIVQQYPRAAHGIAKMEAQTGSDDACLRAGEVWVEILAPVETAHARIMQALEGVVLPEGLFVAKSERGTLLLNAKAWATFHTPLKSLTNLQMQHPNRGVSSQGLRFCLQT